MLFYFIFKGGLDGVVEWEGVKGMFVTQQPTTASLCPTVLK